MFDEQPFHTAFSISCLSVISVFISNAAAELGVLTSIINLFLNS